jgi:hypothetical protein
MSPLTRVKPEMQQRFYKRIETTNGTVAMDLLEVQSVRRPTRFIDT